MRGACGTTWAPLRAKIQAGETVFGTFVKLNAPAVVEIIGRSGFDFAVLDCEHASFTFGQVEEMVRAGDAVSLEIIVRVGDHGKDDIGHVLDAGAAGLQIPGWESLADLEAAAKEAKYYPEGERGLSFAIRAAGYGLTDKSSYMRAANDGTCIVVHMESRNKLAHLEALCDLPPIDVVFIGPLDLSQSFGVPGDVQHPDVKAAIAQIFEVCARKNKAVGIFAASTEDIRRYREMGARYIVCSTDVGMLISGIKQTVEGIRNSAR
jgi:4-hydroxy-2-oxoheptanedioate aldolase